MKHAGKARIYPTPEQQDTLSKSFGCDGWFWDYSLTVTNRPEKETGNDLSWQGISDPLPGLKREDQGSIMPHGQGLKSVSLTPLRASITVLEEWVLCAHAELQHDQPATQYPQNVQIIQIIDAGLKRPRVRPVLAKIHRTVDRKLKYGAGSPLPSGVHFASFLFASFLFDDGLPEVGTTIDGKPVGIDLCLTYIAMTSDGSRCDHSTPLRKYACYLKQRQKDLNYRRVSSRSVAKFNEEIVDIRKNVLNKLSSCRSADGRQAIAMGNLAVQSRVKNHALVKAVSDFSWIECTSRINYTDGTEERMGRDLSRFSPASKMGSVCLKLGNCLTA